MENHSKKNCFTEIDRGQMNNNLTIDCGILLNYVSSNSTSIYYIDSDWHDSTNRLYFVNFVQPNIKHCAKQKQQQKKCGLAFLQNEK